MKRALFEQLLAARAEKRPVALVTALSSGEQALVFGSVEEVAESLQAFDEMGYSDVIVRNLSSDQSESLATIERLGLVRELIGSGS